MRNVEYERYRELACTSIAFGINEYLKESKCPESDEKFEQWIEECIWFDILPLNRALVIKQVEYLKEIGLQRIYYTDIWKGYKVRTKCQKEK